jgi:hypothetical protein
VRLLICQACDEEIEVYEEPVQFLEPATYICGQCREAGHSQLALVPDDDPEPGIGRRSEERAYDPKQAGIPY